MKNPLIAVPCALALSSLAARAQGMPGMDFTNPFDLIRSSSCSL